MNGIICKSLNYSSITCSDSKIGGHTWWSRCRRHLPHHNLFNPSERSIHSAYHHFQCSLAQITHYDRKLTLIEPWWAAAPKAASTMRKGKVALKDLWEYKRWYPIAILQQVTWEWGWPITALISVNGWPKTWEHPGKECQTKDGRRLCRHRPMIHTCESSKMDTKEECNIWPPNFWFWFQEAHDKKKS